jgi:uncharacterized membrane protein
MKNSILFVILGIASFFLIGVFSRTTVYQFSFEHIRHDHNYISVSLAIFSFVCLSIALVRLFKSLPMFKTNKYDASDLVQPTDINGNT